MWQTELKSTEAHLFFDSWESFHSEASGALQKIIKYAEQIQLLDIDKRHKI
jgi:hypothetical protein